MILRGWRSFTGITTAAATTTIATTIKTPGFSILGAATTTQTRCRGATVAAFCTARSSGNREGMENKEKNDENDHDNDDDDHHHRKKKDTMSHSFGVGYGTRSDEEGFGGIYGGGYATEDPEHHANHPEYDKSQGSEVKEKEKARNLSDDAAATGHAHDQRAAAAAVEKS